MGALHFPSQAMSVLAIVARTIADVWWSPDECFCEEDKAAEISR